jgi:hypothetical protein
VLQVGSTGTEEEEEEEEDWVRVQSISVPYLQAEHKIPFCGKLLGFWTISIVRCFWE